jgi:RNA-binding protein YlmH
MPLAGIASGNRKRQQVIVPSLRVDALGAKAFGVSRSYFSKGIAAGNVLLNGKRVGKAADAEAGDEIYAEGLGRCHIVMVQGETRKGNLKVMLEVEK